jgi:FkbM family methyltransferase
MTTIRINDVPINAVEEHYPGFWQRAAEGQWEPSTYALIDRYVSPETVFLDIGSHIGAIALYAAARAARVICVEADPVSLRKLRANVAANPSLAERITIIDRALYPTHEPIVFGSRSNGGDSMSTFALRDLKTTWPVETITPRELVALTPIEVPLFVKMDIEGGEYIVVPAAGVLWSRPNLVFLLSTHPQLFGALDTLGVVLKSRRVLHAMRGYHVSSVDDCRGVVPRRQLSVTDRVKFELGRAQTLLFSRPACAISLS